ncbi:uncharacterized protein METZ01_LOCUS108039 [marine metagenome]|uniref:Uncharacterized protein n=1 Tax=marine metagenome TaxID=408172 RepID=A0A381WRS1_9ZZZZ
MDVLVHLDGDPTIREEGFYEAKVFELTKQVKDLQSALSEMTVENTQLRERVKQLATRQPQWPKGYRPRRHNPRTDKKHGNWQPSERRDAKT